MQQDLKLAWKRLRNSPGFTVIAAVTLAFAAGANTAIFTVADAVLFRPLPYYDPDRLFVVRMLDLTTGERSSGVPYEYVASIQRHHSGVEAVALRSTTMMLDHAGQDGGESVETFSAAPDYLRVLGAPMARGRHFDAEDALSPAGRRIVLTYECWQKRFGGDEQIIGREVRLGSWDRTVVGVLAPRFIFPSASLFFFENTTGRAEFVTVAMPPDPREVRKRNSIVRGGMAIDAVVRLKPGVSLVQAQAELEVLTAGVKATRPADGPVRVVLEDVRSVLFPSGRRALVALLASSGLVLLIGCANLASLLVARTRRREREIALHAALGARPLHAVRQLIFEALIIGTSAGALAVAATYLCSGVLLREVPPVVYGRAFVEVDLRVAMFGIGIAIVASLLFAAIPAYSAARSNPSLVLRKAAPDGPGGFWRMGQPLVVMQVTLALVVAAAGLTAAREFRSVSMQPLGFTPTNLLAISVRPGFEEHVLRGYFERVVRSVRQHGDVLAAGAASSRPFDRGGGADSLVPQRPDIWVAHALPGYLEALGVDVHDGRLPDSGQGPTGLEPVVLTASASAKLFPGRRAVGETLSLEGRNGEVVAVVDDIRTEFEDAPSWAFVVPRSSTHFRTLLIRTRAQRADILADIRRRVASLTPPDAPVPAKWLDESIGAHSAYRTPRFHAVILGSFSGVALGLATLGVFATVAAAVASRSREIGVRIAVGATPTALVRLFVRELAVPIGVGITLGVVVALFGRRLLDSQVEALADPEPWSLGIATIVLSGAGLVAAYLPARRATRVDPIVVLRAE